MLISATSFIKINDDESQKFYHLRGLRQGDPLSPMLFDLPADTLQYCIAKAHELMQPYKIFSSTILQYADDTLLFDEASPFNMKVVVHTTKFFTSLTGLTINNAKSTVKNISIPQYLQGIFSGT